ncbi:MAG: Mur ligase family protein [Candidatus Gastranaerophilaceae bacterium]|jgi:UDP-N-acetylmuramyl tripeptide synthase
MLRDTLAIFLARLSSLLLKVFKVGAGTSLPGKIAFKISPSLLSKLVKQTRREIISVTGTNGKTTTCGFIAGILKTDNRTFVHNRRGANMLEGIITAAIEKSNLLGQLNIDNCLFESDEAYLAKMADFFTADYLVITNLFRDQLDRYGELDTTAKKIEAAIDKFTQKKDTVLLINADDPTVAKLGKNAKKIYFGFEEIEFMNLDKNVETPKEVASCPCGSNLNYSKIFYAHMGHYYCHCGYQRPNLNIIARAKVYTNHSEIEIKYPEKNIKVDINVDLPGLYNTYNALAAGTLGLCMNISPEIIKIGVENYSTVFGRAEKLVIQNKNVIVQLIKNPAGATEVLRTVKDDPDSKLLIIINDNYADGRDVSWLWDANFELIKKHSKNIIVSGIRASDMAVRLKYAGIPHENIKIQENISKAINESISQTSQNEKLYIMPTYTALLDMQKILNKL